MNNERLDKLERFGFIFVTVLSVVVIILWLLVFIVKVIQMLT
jgi:hypothetical protein